MMEPTSANAGVGSFFVPGVPTGLMVRGASNLGFLANILTNVRMFAGDDSEVGLLFSFREIKSAAKH